jgi:hypothetical protein
MMESPDSASALMMFEAMPVLSLPRLAIRSHRPESAGIT